MNTIKEIHSNLKAKKISALELASEYLKNIKLKNKDINAFVYLNEDLTKKEAIIADKMLASNKYNILTGIPIAYKDLFCHKDWQTTAASKILYNFISPYTATVVNNLVNCGMVTLGRTNMDEFAMGSTNETSFYGASFNPWNLNHVSGGSSGGSAAAVASGLSVVALGSDTGGSIRQPCAYCGITGIKPTYGRVSRFGMIAYASSFDQAGPMARDAQDCALLLNYMCSFDDKDSTSLANSSEDFTLNLEAPLKGRVIGIPKEYFTDNIDQDVASSIEEVKKILLNLGAKIIEISLPNTKLCIPCYYILSSAEASTNLSRYDGVRYGYRTKKYNNLDQMYENTRSEGFGKEVKRRILIGTYVLSHGYYDEYYIKAQRLRKIIIEDYKKAFENCDIILTPVSSTVAPKIGNLIEDPVKMYLSDIFTVSLNLAGLPGISIPSKLSNNGLPIGVQLIGNHFQESMILNCAHQIQNNSDWHLKNPTFYVNN